jgi:hypothetical protein
MKRSGATDLPKGVGEDRAGARCGSFEAPVSPTRTPEPDVRRREVRDQRGNRVGRQRPPEELRPGDELGRDRLVVGFRDRAGQVDRTDLGPEQIAVAVLVTHHHTAVGEDDLRRHQAVRGHPLAPAKDPEPAPSVRPAIPTGGQLPPG